MTNVLVVDDEFDIRELLVDTILDTGLEVIDARMVSLPSKESPLSIRILSCWISGCPAWRG
jgi:DNA-binding NtrC family response regulator